MNLFKIKKFILIKMEPIRAINKKSNNPFTNVAVIIIKNYIKIPIYKYYLLQMNFQKIFIG